MARDKDQKVYMPLMIGDWLKGTSGMKAEVRGVYINLLLHQWDHGFIPEDIEEISLIAPEVGKVWDKLRVKFPKVENGKLQNSKLEKVRAFWRKQVKNGKKGGRPPRENPELNPNKNPNTNLHNDLDLDNDSVFKNRKEFDFKKPDVEGEQVIFPIDTPAMRDLWAAWKESKWHNYELRYGLHGEQADLSRMQGMTFHQMQEIIKKAIAGKWKNLYMNQGKSDGNFKNKKQQHTDSAVEYVANHYSNKPGK